MVEVASAMQQKPGLRTAEESVGLPFEELVARLRELLGARMVAYIGGVKSSRPVSEWVSGRAKPSETERERLRHAYHAAALLRERYDVATVQSWFQGMNPVLGDLAPAQVLAGSGDELAAAADVLAAAKSFAYIG